MKKNEMLTLKANIVGGMNEVVKNMNDETAYERWTYLVPDECTEDDLIFIAEDDDLYTDVCTLFGELVRLYGADMYTDD